MKAKIIVNNNILLRLPIYNQGQFGQKLQFKIVDSSDNVIDITDYTITLKLRILNDFNEYLLKEICTIDDASNGLCSYTFNAGDLFLSGSFDVTLEVDSDTINDEIDLGFLDVSEVEDYSTPGTIISSAGDTDDLPEGGSNLYFTNERVDDRFNNLIQDSNSIAWTYDDVSNTLEANAQLENLSTDNLPEGSSNLYYESFRVKDDMNVALQDTSQVTWTYGSNEFRAYISLNDFSTDDLSEGTNLYYTQARFDTAFNNKSTTDLSEGTNLYFTDERVDDRVSSLLVDNTKVTWTYDDVSNTLEASISLNDFSTDDLSEGSSNLYYTDERAQDAVGNILTDTSDIVWDYDDVANTIKATVVQSSVNHNDVSGLQGGTTNEYYHLSSTNYTDLTDGGDSSLHYHSSDRSRSNHTGTQLASTISNFSEAVDDRVNGLLVGGDNITLTYDDVGNTLTIDGTDLVLTEEQVQDYAWNVLTGTQTLISVTYDDVNNNVDFVVNDDLSLYDNSTSNFFDTAGNALTSTGSTVNVDESAINTSLVNNDAGFISDITAENIGTLSDVTITTVADNEILQYDNVSGNWINQTFTEADIATNTDLTNHTIDSTIHYTQSSISITASQVSDFDTEVSNNVNVSANTTHISSDGSDHTFINQDVTSGSSPVLSNTNMTGNVSVWTNDSGYLTDITSELISDLSNVVFTTLSSNDILRYNGTNFINVDFDTEVSNNTDVAANTTHRSSDGSDHTFINQDVTTTGTPTFGSVTVNDALFDSVYDNGNSGATATVDWTNGNLQEITLDQNTTLSFTDPSSSARVQLLISGGATYSITWPTITWLTSGGTAPTLDGNDIVTLFFDGTNYYGTISNQS